MRVFDTPNSISPEVNLLSNGRYHLMVTTAGGSYSRWQDLAITRWREDATRDAFGYLIYLCDSESGEFWSTAYQPTLHLPKDYGARFSGASAEFSHRRGELEVRTVICVARDDDVELRRVTLTNHSSTERSIELTSYAEIVLADPRADAAHPVFSNLFVQTEFLKENGTIFCTRRPRAEGDRHPCLFHSILGSEGASDEISCETDRARFIGRGRTPENPAAMQHGLSLSGTVGSVLDPIVSLRRSFKLAPHQTLGVDFVLGVTEDRGATLTLAQKYKDPQAIDHCFELARTDVALNELGITEAQAQLYTQAAGALLYANPSTRAAPAVLLKNRLGQSSLWKYGVSGDIPIVLLRMSDPEKLGLVQELIEAHAYWRIKGLSVDLVILISGPANSARHLHNQINGLVKAETLGKPAGVCIRHLGQVPPKDLALLGAAARIVLSDKDGGLAYQLGSGQKPKRLPPTLKRPKRYASPDKPEPLAARELVFNNGFGGFTPDGRDYVITLEAGQSTPLPWVNVIANPSSFGTVISESGCGYTWAENSHELRLTPWNNDPVSDPTGEAFYIRDEKSGAFWSPTPLPARGKTPYVIRHGFGYSVFEHTENGIQSELTVYVAMDAPVKVAVLKLRNVSGRPRRISVTGYYEWVLGEQRQKSALHVQTQRDSATGALLARNSYNADFPGRVAFVDAGELPHTLTGDRTEFLGRNGSVTEPAAMRRKRLSGKTGVGLDPCAAVQVTLELPDQGERETQFCLGAGGTLAEAQSLIQRFRQAGAAHSALEGVRAYWQQTLGAVSVETPDPSVNLMANGWLLYQVLSCRLWGRTGFYQSGGAFGFRDQLQDSASLVYARPDLTREHLLRAAAHQFREGDVEHWWHPPTDMGSRTRTSDDYLWLPYVTCHYVSFTGDASVLDENVSFMEGRQLRPDEEADYERPTRSQDSGTLYEHCVRAIERGLSRIGAHGLPLMGSCDWNDGMNQVGKDGRGESVWLAFFFYDVLMQFAEVARDRNDLAFSDRCLTEARKFQENVEEHAWDGQWYTRAYFDNGEPLGSHTNTECQIDSIPQSWSVISGAGNPERARQAMMSAEERLVHPLLIQLFDPPFDRSVPSPGYIQGYVPGIRENGGQYTHAATWLVIARALLGDNDRAWELFSILNPVNHGMTADQIATYKVEPYVVAADVYAVAPHTGRGGWTWYTGSAGWMYRILTETLLGLKLEGNELRLTPRLPKAWATCKIDYRYRQTLYRISIFTSPDGSPGTSQITLNGVELSDGVIPLVDDQGEHKVELGSFA